MPDPTTTPPAPRDDEGEGATQWGRWVGVGFEFGVAVLLFFLFGSFLDARWGTSPWLKVGGALAGIVAGTYLLIRQAIRSEQADRDLRNLKAP
jgi:F0F1-type ATP synthase assembly protein I